MKLSDLLRDEIDGDSPYDGQLSEWVRLAEGLEEALRRAREHIGRDDPTLCLDIAKLIDATAQIASETSK